MIYFNVLEARNQLLNNGFVYTLRTRHRRAGITVAMHHAEPICIVLVQRITIDLEPEELYKYLSHSGFDDVYKWVSKAANGNRTLYLVTKI